MTDAALPEEPTPRRMRTKGPPRRVAVPSQDKDNVDHSTVATATRTQGGAEWGHMPAWLATIVCGYVQGEALTAVSRAFAHANEPIVIRRDRRSGRELRTHMRSTRYCVSTQVLLDDVEPPLAAWLVGRAA